MFIGHQVDINLYRSLDGSKSFTGILKSRNDKETIVETAGGEIIFDNDSIAQIRLHVDF